MHSEERFGRKSWGLLSLELWQRAFHDRGREFRRLLIPSHIGRDDFSRQRAERREPGRNAAG